MLINSFVPNPENTTMNIHIYEIKINEVNHK